MSISRAKGFNYTFSKISERERKKDQLKLKKEDLRKGKPK